jgi:hypothetical protein
MKFIYTPWKCKYIIFIYIHVNIDVEYEMCKYKIIDKFWLNYIYIMILHGYVKQCKKCDFYLRRGDFIMFFFMISQLKYLPTLQH